MAVDTLKTDNTGSFLTPDVWSKDILYANTPNFIFLQYSTKALDADGKTIRWAVSGTLNTGARLYEGTVMTAGTLAISQITSTPLEYGNLISWSRMNDVLAQNVTDIRNNIAYQEIRRDYQQLMDATAYAALVAGTFYVGGGTFGTANPAVWGGTLGSADYKMNPNILFTAVEQLKLRNVPTFSGGNYVAILHVTQMTQLFQNATFTSAQNYAAPMTLLNGAKPNGYRTSFAGLDLLESTNITTASLAFGTSGTVTAYRGVAFGQEAFGDGWAIPLELTYYDELNVGDAKRTKGIAWYALGHIKVLKPANVVLLRTT